MKNWGGSASGFNLGHGGWRRGSGGSGDFFNVTNMAVRTALNRGVVRGIERYAEAF